MDSDKDTHLLKLEQALKKARETSVSAVTELGDQRDALVDLLTKIIHVVDRVNPAGRTCSINDMTKALLEIREAAFQAVAVPAEHESRQPPPHLSNAFMSSFDCVNCNQPSANHCSIHLIPCCPGKCKGPQETQQNRFAKSAWRSHGG